MIELWNVESRSRPKCAILTLIVDVNLIHISVEMFKKQYKYYPYFNMQVTVLVNFWKKTV